MIRDENGTNYQYTERPTCEDTEPRHQSSFGTLQCAVCCVQHILGV